MVRGSKIWVAAVFTVLLAGAFASADEAVEDGTAKARSLRLAGRYGDAQDTLEKLLESDEGDVSARRELAELFVELGRFSAAAAVAGEAGADPACRTLLAESLLERGRLDEAEKELRAVLEADPEHVRARYALGTLHLARGEREKALSAFDWFFSWYAKNDVVDPEALTLVAAASLRAAELQPDVAMDFGVSMKILDTVTKEHPEYLPAYIVRGDIYISVYQDRSANKSYTQALKLNPRYPPALFGQARALDFRFNQLGGVEKCKEALLTNGNLYEAKEYLVRTLINDSQYEEAKKLLDEILSVNPKRKLARALLAAMDFVMGKRDSFDSRVAGLLAEDPKFSPAYRELVGVLEQQRRFEDAAHWAKRATEVDDTDFMAWWQYGRNLVHMAKETEAREALQRSRELDPFAHYMGNAFRENMAQVLGHLEEFVETRTPHFVYKTHVGESEVLTRYYHRFMEESYRKLTEKYGFEPEGPVLTEVFHIHADFAARTIGLPGIGALGACFGKVITLDSPSARKPGAFSWASTAHHEFAHVMTLQLSKGRVPRWFTEGLSVYEERQWTDWWERDMDRRLYDAYMNDEIYEIAKFNRAFRGGDVLFAYYLGGMMCEFMADEFGWPKILEMLRAYGEDKQTAKVLEEVLGVTPGQYDARFRKWVGEFVGSFEMVPRWSNKTLKEMNARLEADPKDAEALITTAWAHFHRGNRMDAMGRLGKALKIAPDEPRVVLLRGELAFGEGRFDKAGEWLGKYLESGEDDLFARLHMAQILEQKMDFAAAMEQYEAAKRCFPSYAGKGNPYIELARLKRGEEDLEGAIREMEAYVRLANTDIDKRIELADWYENEDETGKLVEILEQVVLIYPLGEELANPVHVRLARAYRKRGEFEKAELEFEVALELGVGRENEVGVRVDLGEVYLLRGRTRDARYQANTALEIEPASERANQLLEKASR